MGFEWGVEVRVVYALAVKPLQCYARFAVRCLKLKPTRKTAKTTKKRHKPASKPKPAAGDRTDRTDDTWPCSDTESDEQAMDKERREVYARIREEKHDDGAYPENVDGFMTSGDAKELLTRSARAAIDTFLPGKAGTFDIRADMYAGNRCEADETAGATRELMYISYTPAETVAGSYLDVSHGGVNVPWGNKMTPIDILDQEERTHADAALVLIADRLGLTPLGAPGFKFLSSASGS